MKLKIKNIENFKFNEESHTYELGGNLLTGVTTILGVRNKDFLKWWTVKLMYETLLPKLKDVQGIDQRQWDALLLEARKAHTVKVKEALTSGKVAHDFIEKIIKSLIEIPLSKEKYLGLMDRFVNEMPKDEKAQASIREFMSWMGKHEVVWYASELRLPSVLNQLAGTIDAVARVDGVLTLVDFKTSNQFNDDTNLQLAAYHLLLDENLEEGEERPTQRLILRIPKDGKSFETKIVDTPLDFDIQTFLHCREIHRWNLLVERLRLENQQVAMKN